MVNNIRFIVQRNLLACMLLVAALWMGCVCHKPVRLFPSMVDWRTIYTLSGLLLITTSMKESGLFRLLAYRIAKKIQNERFLALFFVFFAAILSMFLTNDIALFVVVPFTMTLQKIVDRDFGKMIIFEAIAVNVGSSLTPIGNPQNIYLWQKWGISFYSFVQEMAPLVLVMSIWLLVMSILCFPSRKIEVSDQPDSTVDRRLFIISTIILVAFIVSVELGYETYSLWVIFLAIFIVRKNIFLKCDWGFIFLFIVIFIDLNLASGLKVGVDLLSMLDFGNRHTLFFSSALFSQVISNVPAAILLARHSTNLKIIAYGVNIGGNGLLIGSFANLIALRLAHRTYRIYFSFHVYSLFYFAVTLLSSFYLFI